MYKTKEKNKVTLALWIDMIVTHIDTIATNHLPIVISIWWWSASGKTSQVSNKIIKYYQNHNISVLHLTMDNYNIGQKEMKNKWMDLTNFDLPEVVDIDLLSTHIHALKHCETIQMPDYSFVNNGPTWHTITIKSANIIVLDGLFVNIKQRKLPVDFKIFVDCSMPGMIIRRLVRDTVKWWRKWQSPIDCLKQLVNTVLPSHIKYILPSRHQSDIVIENDFDPIKEPILAPINDQSEIKFEYIIEKNIYPIYSSYARILLLHQFNNNTKKYFFVYDDDWNHNDNNYSIRFEIDKDLYNKIKKMLQSDI